MRRLCRPCPSPPLAPGTTVATALQCTRRAWLQERFGGAPGDKALLGTLGHELLQRAIGAAGRGGGAAIDAAWLEARAREVVAAAGEKLLEVGLCEAAAAEALARQVPAISEWVAAYMPAPPGAYRATQHVAAAGPGGGGGDGDGDGMLAVAAADAPLGGAVDAGAAGGGARPSGAGLRGCVTAVADIEENIWAPKYGLKGQLDASLVVQLSECEPARSYGRSLSGPAGVRGWGSAGFGGADGGAPAGAFRGWGHSTSTNSRGAASGGASGHPLAALGPGPGPGPGRCGSTSCGGGGGGGGGPWGGTEGGGGGGGAASVAAAQASAQGLAITAQRQVLAPFEFKTGKDYFTHRCGRRRAGGGACVPAQGRGSSGRSASTPQRGSVKRCVRPRRHIREPRPLPAHSAPACHPARRAQVSLYLLLMEERYRSPVTAGLLWNVNQPSMQLVPRKQQELAPLLARRNALAAHLWQERPAAPPMLQVQPWGRGRGPVPKLAGLSARLLPFALACEAHRGWRYQWRAGPRATRPPPTPRPQPRPRAHDPNPSGPARLPALPQRRPVCGLPRNGRGGVRRERGHGARPV
jgi:hypothetical protein